MRTIFKTRAKTTLLCAALFLRAAAPAFSQMIDAGEFARGMDALARAMSEAPPFDREDHFIVGGELRLEGGRIASKHPEPSPL